MIVVDLAIFTLALLGSVLYENLSHRSKINKTESKTIIDNIKNNKNKKFPRRISTRNIHNLSIF